MNKPAVTVEHLTKSFRIPLESSSGIKQKLLNALKGRKGYRKFTPLNDISFVIEKGDFFGIVGRNGSGKSTLLKTIAGIYEPNEGAVIVDGTLVPFIELGVGFNPELTGRENVFLNGALLGFSRHEMEVMYHDIVEFAELTDFMEERLKNYSSGMQVRLAFSIAIRANADVLLLDEVLAVGDEAFQRKCFSYFDKLKREHKTVILVTHDMGAVQRFCTKALFLKDGQVDAVGQPDAIASLYNKQNDEMYARSIENDSTLDTPSEELESRITLNIKNGRGDKVRRFTEGEEIEIELSWPYDNINHAGVALLSAAGLDVFSPNTYREKLPPITSKALKYSMRLNIAPGDYYIKAALFDKHDKDIVDRTNEAVKIIVEKSDKDSPYVGVTRLSHKWVEG